jgi:hypothetical protein
LFWETEDAWRGIARLRKGCTAADLDDGWAESEEGGGDLGMFVEAGRDAKR